MKYGRNIISKKRHGNASFSISIVNDEKKKKKKRREKNLREFNKTQFLISAPGYKITNPKAFKRSDNIQK